MRKRMCAVVGAVMVTVAALSGCRQGQLIRSETVRMKTAADVPAIHCERPIVGGVQCTAFGVEGMGEPQWRAGLYRDHGWSVLIPLERNWTLIEMLLDGKVVCQVRARQRHSTAPIEYERVQAEP